MKRVLLSLVLLSSCMTAFGCADEKCSETDLECIFECAADCAEKYSTDADKAEKCADDCV